MSLRETPRPGVDARKRFEKGHSRRSLENREAHERGGQGSIHQAEGFAREEGALQLPVETAKRIGHCSACRVVVLFARSRHDLALCFENVVGNFDPRALPRSLARIARQERRRGRLVEKLIDRGGLKERLALRDQNPGFAPLRDRKEPKGPFCPTYG